MSEELKGVLMLASRADHLSPVLLICLLLTGANPPD